MGKSLEILDAKQNSTRAKKREAGTLLRLIGEVKCMNRLLIDLPDFLRSREPEMC